MKKILFNLSSERIEHAALSRKHSFFFMKKTKIKGHELAEGQPS